MIVERIFDVKKCLDILTDAEMFYSISEDGATFEDLKVDVINNYWLGIYEDINLIGVLLLRPLYSECFDIHIHILKKYRKHWKSAGLAVIEWCKKNMPNKTLHTNVPVFCKNVRCLVLSLGFKEVGVIPKVWKKNGIMNDMSIFTRPVSNKTLTFLRIPKNASTSLYSFFGAANTIRNEYLGADNSKYLNVFEPSHCTLQEAKELLGDYVAELPILAVVRNPYDRMVSMFFFAKKYNLGQLYGIKMDSFDSFVDGFYKASKNPDFFHAKPQCDYISGNESVTVCRFENLQNEISQFIDDKGLIFNINELQKLNDTEHEDYKSYYTDKSKELVTNMWQDDLTRFSYSF